MTSTSPNRATQFIAAFNDIEHSIRERFHARPGTSFARLVQLAKNEGILLPHDADTLLEFTELRNAISHGTYTKDFQPIADPTVATVQAIIQLRQKVLHPQPILSILPHQIIQLFTPETSLREVLGQTFRKFPIYDDKQFLALITADDILHWMQSCGPEYTWDLETSLATIKHASPKAHHCVFLPRTASVTQVLQALTQPVDGVLPKAVFITEHGNRKQRPLRIVTGSEISPLIVSESLY